MSATDVYELRQPLIVELLTTLAFETDNESADAYLTGDRLTAFAVHVTDYGAITHYECDDIFDETSRLTISAEHVKVLCRKGENPPC